MKRIFFTCVFFILAGCPSFEHKNPYDPDAPPALQKKATIRGEVILERQEDHSGAIITAGSFTTQSFSDGSFSLEVFPYTEYKLLISKSNFEEREIDIPPLKPGDIHDIGQIEIRLQTGSIQGAVILEEALTFEGAVVMVAGTDIYSFTDSKGSFFLPAVPAGTYNLSITKSGYEEKNISGVKVLHNKITDTGTSILFLQRGDIQGKAFLEGSNDHSGISIIVEGAGKTGFTDSSGNFLITQIPVGTYDLTFRKTGYVDSILMRVRVERNKITDAKTTFLYKPPSAPKTISSFQAGPDYLILQWFPNPETDLSGYNIYRWSYENPTVEKINSSLITPSYKNPETYTVTVTGVGIYEFYAITAVDEQGLESPVSEFEGYHELLPFREFPVKVTGIPFQNPSGIAFSRSGEFAFVANNNGNYLSIIDVYEDSVTGKIEVKGASSCSDCDLYDVVSNPVKDELYVSVQGTMEIAFVDLLTGDVKYLYIPDSSNCFTVITYITPDSDGSRIFVSCEGDGYVEVISTDYPSIITEIDVNSDNRCGNVYETAYANNKLYVLCENDIVRVVDVETSFTKIKDILAGGAGERIESSRDENYVFVSLTDWSGDAGPDRIMVISTSDDSVLMRVPVDNRPRGIATTSAGAYIVHENMSPQLNLIGLSHLPVYFSYPSGSIESSYTNQTFISASPDGMTFYITRTLVSGDYVIGRKY